MIPEGPVTTTSWRIYDRARDQWPKLRGPMTEAACRAYVARFPERLALVRVEAITTYTEVPVSAEEGEDL